MSEDQLAKIARLISFEKQIRETKSLVELQYTLTNELRNVIPFAHAFFCYWPKNKKITVAAVSDIAVVDRTSIIVNTIEKIGKQKMHENFGEVHSFIVQKNQDDTPSETGEGYLPSNFVWVPCASVHNDKQGILILTKHTECRTPRRDHKTSRSGCARSRAPRARARRRSRSPSSRRR